MRTSFVLGLALAGTGCTRPPDTPEGLDQSLRHLMQAFHGSDAEVAAGLTGLSSWYAAEGQDLLGRTATLENVGSFSLADLTEEDVSRLSPRPASDPGHAPGVIAVAELPCRWRRAEDLLIRSDQDEVFTDFDYYDRTYVSARDPYDAARREDRFPTVDGALDPAAADEATFLRTTNRTAGTEMGVTIEFDLEMHARHGRFEVDGEPARAGLYLTWMPERAEAPGGVNTMEQSYTFEVDLEHGDETLWVYASWSEVNTSVFASDAPALMAISANKAQGTAKRMAAICQGDVALAEEAR